MYGGLTGSEVVKYTVNGLVLEILERPRFLSLKEQLMRSIESIIKVQAYGGIT